MVKEFSAIWGDVMMIILHFVIFVLVLVSWDDIPGGRGLITPPTVSVLG